MASFKLNLILYFIISRTLHKYNHDEYHSTFARRCFWLNWLRLFYVWQKTESACALGLWFSAHAFFLFCGKYFSTHHNRQHLFNCALFYSHLDFMLRLYDLLNNIDLYFISTKFTSKDDQNKRLKSAI